MSSYGPLSLVYISLSFQQLNQRLSANVGPYDFNAFLPNFNICFFVAGRLSYAVDTENKELSVSVSDMLEDHNYHLRLCHKDFICVGTGASTLVSTEE